MRYRVKCQYWCGNGRITQSTIPTKQFIYKLNVGGEPGRGFWLLATWLCLWEEGCDLIARQWGLLTSTLLA